MRKHTYFCKNAGYERTENEKILLSAEIEAINAFAVILKENDLIREVYLYCILPEVELVQTEATSDYEKQGEQLAVILSV